MIFDELYEKFEEKLNKTISEQTEIATLLVEDYRIAKDSNAETWKERNRNFIILVICCGLYVLISFRDSEITQLLNAILRKYVESEKQTNTDVVSLPFTLLQVALMIVILYLVINIYHRTRGIFRNFIYLNKLELTIHDKLKLGDATGFGRENSYYQNDLPSFQTVTKLVYVVVLGMLFCAIGNALYFSAQTQTLTSVLLQAIPFAGVTVYYALYAFSVIFLDNREVLQGKPPGYFKDAAAWCSTSAHRIFLLFWIALFLIISSAFLLGSYLSGGLEYSKVTGIYFVWAFITGIFLSFFGVILFMFFTWWLDTSKTQ